jgi:hypothetical protein
MRQKRIESFIGGNQMRRMFIFTLAAFLFLGTGRIVVNLDAGEKTLSYEDIKITVKTYVAADVLKVRPYIKGKKGKKGSLWLDIEIQNTGEKPQSYSVSGDIKIEKGGVGWGFFNKKFPKKMKLDPGSKATVKIRTRYKGKNVPHKLILVEVYQGL